MEQASEYLEEFDFFEEDNECGVFTYLVDNAEKGDLCKVIEQAQKDAIVATLKLAAEKADCSYDEVHMEDRIDKDTILSLKDELFKSLENE
jgi:hypothetical protein